MKKFKGNRPLLIYHTHPDKFLLEYRDVDPPKTFNLYQFMRVNPLEEKKYNIVFGSKRKPEDFTQYNYLHCCEGPGLILHERVLTVLQEICPEDFQAFPILIKNFNPKTPPFENKDYYILNLLHEIDALDKEKSRLRFDHPEAPEWFSIQRLVFKETSMGDHHLGRLKGYLPIELLSPFLATHLTKLKLTKGIKFLTEKEAYSRLLPEEILQYYLNNKEYEAARRAFIPILNNSRELEDFKKYLHLIPRASVEKLIDLVLERSSLPQKECNELRELLAQRKE